MHVGQQACNLHGPETEISDGSPDCAGSGGSQMFEDGDQQTEVFFAGFVGGKELFGNFGEKIESAGGGEIMKDGELRLDEFAGIDIDEFAILSLVVRHSDLRKPFQARSETTLWPPRATGDSPQLAVIAGEEADHGIRFLEGPGLQDESFAHTSGHIY